MTTTIKLPFGLRDSQLVHISEVDGGLACRCICPSCAEPLVAKKGKVTVQHFAHAQGADCPHAVETALHLAAKGILSEVRLVMLPAVRVHYSSFRDPILVSAPRTYQLDEVYAERRTGSIVPDILAYVRGIPLLIEIRVTHEVDNAKATKIQALGISAIEINLSSFTRSFSRDELVETVVKGVTHKEWIFNARASRLRDIVLESAERKLSNANWYGNTVRPCPLRKRMWEGRPYADVNCDCYQCDFLFEAEQLEMGSMILCGGRNRLITLERLLAFEQSHEPSLSKHPKE